MVASPSHWPVLRGNKFALSHFQAKWPSQCLSAYFTYRPFHLLTHACLPCPVYGSIKSRCPQHPGPGQGLVCGLRRQAAHTTTSAPSSLTGGTHTREAIGSTHTHITLAPSPWPNLSPKPPTPPPHPIIHEGVLVDETGPWCCTKGPECLGEIWPLYATKF